MNPFTHDTTTLTSRAPVQLEEVTNHGLLYSISHSVIAVDLDGAYVSPETNEASLTNSPKEQPMTTMYSNSVFDAGEELEINAGDESKAIAHIATARTAYDEESVLLRRSTPTEPSTPDSIEAEAELQARAAKHARRLESKADEGDDIPMSADELVGDVGYVALNALSGQDAPEDVWQAMEEQDNLGLTLVEKTPGKAFMTLTLGDSCFFELALHNANHWDLTTFAKRVNDFRAYNSETEAEMCKLADAIVSNGRQFDSHGFEACVLEDAGVRAFIRHCVNVAQGLKFDLFFDKRGEKRCKGLAVKRAPAVSKELIMPVGVASDAAPQFHTESGHGLTAVYAYVAPVKAPAAAEPEVKAVKAVAPKAVAPAAIVAPAKTAPASQGKVTEKKAEVAPRKVAKPPVQSKPARKFLKAGEEVSMKVVRFAKFGAIIKDELGNEGFLGFVGREGGVRHDRLVVQIGDEVKVVVKSVDGNGFVKTALLSVADLTNHFLSCLKIGDILPAVVLRKAQHCFYVTVGGPVDGILAVRDIPNPADVKDALRANARLNVRVLSVSPDRQNFHVAIDSLHGAAK